MTDITALKKRNAARWEVMHLDPKRMGTFDAAAHRLVGLKPVLDPIAAHPGMNAPWWALAVVLERECGGRTDRYLGNGQRLDHKTTIVPIGRGPFLGATAFARGCYDAWIDCAPQAGRWGDWTAGGAMTLFELYNGLGYAMRGVPSPYVWSGSDQYRSGKYVADHQYSPVAIDTQIGCAPLLSRMRAIDPTIQFTGEAPAAPPLPLAPEPSPEVATAQPKVPSAMSWEDEITAWVIKSVLHT